MADSLIGNVANPAPMTQNQCQLSAGESAPIRNHSMAGRIVKERTERKQCVQVFDDNVVQSQSKSLLPPLSLFQLTADSQNGNVATVLTRLIRCQLNASESAPIQSQTMVGWIVKEKP